MITVIRNLIIIPLTRDDYTFRGDIAFENGTIIYCDKKAYKGFFDKEIITVGKIALPGFKNAHSHAAMVFLKGTAENTPFNKWLFDICIPSEQKLTPCY